MADRALELCPELASAAFNRGRALLLLGRHEEGVLSLMQAIGDARDHVRARCELGKYYLETGDVDNSVQHLEQAAALDSSCIDAPLTLAIAYQRRGEYYKSGKACSVALRLRPWWPECHNNLGSFLMMEGKLDAAIDTLRRAIELDPSNAVARRNLAFAYMKAGDFERGWAELEWRCLLSEEGLRTLDVGRPEWNGCSLKGRTILVRTEQGLGDTIQYVRFLRHLSAEGARVVLQCQGPLVALLKRCPGAHAVIGNGEPVPDIDTHVRLMGIPAILRVVPGTLGNDVPYVHPEEGRRAQWKDVGAGTFAVGIAWQGAKAFEHDTIRSIPLREFIPLIDVPGVTLISLQRGDGTEQLLSK